MNEFIYADALKQRFHVFGHYYDLQIDEQAFPCRSVADVLSIELNADESTTPDAVVIMMNPGSSKPADETFQPQTYSLKSLISSRRKKQYTQIKPDNTQYQMMRLMLKNNWKHLRIVNLSDLREGNSGTFAQIFKQFELIDADHTHSVLHPKRQKQLLQDCKHAKAVILAWGSNAVQKHHAQACLDLFKKHKIKFIGLPLEAPWYRFASPYRKDQKLDWLKSVSKLVETV